MQTIRIPYSTDPDGAALIAELRRIQSAAIRQAYVSAVAPDGAKRSERDVRAMVKARYAGRGVADSWLLHCATRIGLDKRKARPEGDIVFGGRHNLQRRRGGLISSEQWKKARLLPFASFGDRQKRRGNQNAHLIDETTLVVKIGRREGGGRSGRTVTTSATLRLTPMRGHAGEIVRQVAKICAEPLEADRINVSYRIDATHVSISVDPLDLPDHPERRRPVRAVAGRALGVDLNPDWIGLTVAENRGDATRLAETRLLDHRLIRLAMPAGSTPELMREALAGACDAAIRLARAYGCGVIAVEKGLGKLRSGGKNRALNRLLNFWARTVFLAQLRRKAGLAGIRVVEVWGGYSTTIGNLAFEAPDACASACEIARRGLALQRGEKDVLPAFEPEVLLRRWKDEALPNAARDALRQARTWGDVHRGLKAAKLGVRRPHPALLDPGVHHTDGHAVRRLRLRRRPGLTFRPLARTKAAPDSPLTEVAQLARAGPPASKCG